MTTINRNNRMNSKEFTLEFFGTSPGRTKEEFEAGDNIIFPVSHLNDEELRNLWQTHPAYFTASQIIHPHQPVAFNPATVKVGQGITLHGFSDATPYEVIAVSKSGKQVTLRKMKATLNREESTLKQDIGGFVAHTSGEQVWDIESDEDGLTQKMNWSNKKQKFTSNGQNATCGATKYYDFNF
jgi:hypothetical protein